MSATAAALPLSFSADQLLTALVGGPGAAVALPDVVLALLEHHHDLAGRAAPDVDLAQLETALGAQRDRGETGEPIGREELSAAAAAHAREQDHELVASADVAAAVLAMARALTAPPTESPVEETRAPENPKEPREPQAAPVTPSPAAEGTEERAVRVFVSSTFRDMQTERDELVKRVFPQLRKLCESRGVTWGEVDLRWGITDEQKAEGQVLPVCLEEIRRCRPYFIGLVGERYGWVPEEIDRGLVEREPWLEQQRGRSVTELEIVHGVLSDPAMAEHSFFYLRDAAYLDSLPDEQQAALHEGPTAEEVDEYGLEEAEKRAEERRKKLTALKERIRESGLPARDYPDPSALGELVLADLTADIDRVYPEGSAPGPLDREAAEHEAFARSRADVYVGRSAYLEALDGHAAGDGPPLVVLGESGSGKSALLANWARAYREAHPDEAVVMHFIGSSPQSSDWAAMLRRLMGELARLSGIEGEIPDRAAELRPAFANWLHMAAARGRVVLVLDALNQLQDREGAPDLVWLPPVIPAGVRLVVSTLPGRPLEGLSRRGWPVLEVEPLEKAEREQLIGEYLAQYRKELGPRQAERVAAAEQAANPLFLRVLLEELRLWGEHETLDERIAHYLAAPAIPDLYRLVLERWQADYERERPRLVADALSLLWAARRGLSEAELLDLLGSDGEPLPTAYWSPFSLAAEQSLGKRAGLLGFAHDYLRQAVRDAYLPTEAEQRAAHLRLADYFDHRRDESRGVDELPWQLAEAASWERLHDLLVEPGFLKRVWDSNEFDVKAHWARIEADSDLRIVDAYQPIIDSPADYSNDHQHVVMTLLSHTGHDRQALAIGHDLVDHYRRRGEPRQLALILGELGYLLADPSQRMAAFREQEEIAGSIGDLAQEANALIGQAAELINQDRLDDAENLLRRQELLARKSGDPKQVHLGLGNRAVLRAKRGEFAIAEELLLEKEKVARQLGDLAGVSSALHNRASARADRGNPASAVPLFEEAARISRALGDRATLVGNLLNWAQASFLAGSRGDAETVLREAMQIAEEDGAQADLQQARDLLRMFEAATIQPVDLSEEVDTAARTWLQEHRSKAPASSEERAELQRRYLALNAAVSSDPANTDALMEFGTVSLELGRLAEAEQAFQGVLERDETYPGFEQIDSQVRHAARQQGSFDLPGAIRMPLCYLGFVYEGLGKHQLAEDYVLDATFGCEDGSVLVLAGKFYLESSSPEVDTAIAYFKHAIELDPTLTAECDRMVQQFVVTHKHLYPPPSWAVIEQALAIWEASK